MNIEEVEPALQQINNRLLTEREFQYIYFVSYVFVISFQRSVKIYKSRLRRLHTRHENRRLLGQFPDWPVFFPRTDDSQWDRIKRIFGFFGERSKFISTSGHQQ